MADNFFLFGMEHLTKGHYAFVNCTRQFLVRDYPTLFSKKPGGHGNPRDGPSR